MYNEQIVKMLRTEIFVHYHGIEKEYLHGRIACHIIGHIRKPIQVFA